eukprot:Rhum_TRINITY_DN24869_c0_g1::Rhum_TRINITY_DN24869_c0_g1_i1::g.180311::m.180311
MGKRRSRKAAPKKAMAKLPSVFDCPFCNHQTTIQVKINYGTQVGKLECRVCGVNAEVRTTHLSKEIDVYCEWMDTCVELNQGKSAAPEDEYGDPSAKRRRVETEDEYATAAFLEAGVDSDGYSDGPGPQARLEEDDYAIAPADGLVESEAGADDF